MGGIHTVQHYTRLKQDNSRVVCVFCPFGTSGGFGYPNDALAAETPDGILHLILRYKTPKQRLFGGRVYIGVCQRRRRGVECGQTGKIFLFSSMVTGCWHVASTVVNWSFGTS